MCPQIHTRCAVTAAIAMGIKYLADRRAQAMALTRAL
jgi:hypothetical protein